MTPFAISGLLTAATCLLLAVFILIRAPRTLPNLLMALFNLSVGIWGLGTMFVGMARTPESAIWAWRLAHVGGFPLGMIFYHLALVLAGVTKRRHVWTTYSLAALSVILCATGVAMSDTRWMFGSLYYHRANVLYGVLMAVWTVIVVYGHRALFLGYRKATGVKRIQLQVVFYGLATGFVGGTSVLLTQYGLPLYPYGNFSIPLYCLIVTYAIVKHGFTDIRIVTTQAGLLLGVYLVVLGSPFLLGWVGRPWLESHFGQEWWLAPLGLCTVLATAGPFAYAYLRRQAEERLLREQRRYQRTLQRASRGMTQVRNVHRLSNLITRVVSGSVKMTHASLFLWDHAQQRYLLKASHGVKRLAVQSRYGLESTHPLIDWLTEQRRVLTAEEAQGFAAAIPQELANQKASLVIPGVIERRLIGFLVLGQKLSGAGYSQDDLHAFTTLANEAAIAIENAMSYEELLKVNEQLKAASERLLLQERLAAAGKFATGMAHEIKNPLSAIKTFAQYLPERYADPKFREKFFRIVQSEIDRINGIVKELLDFAKPAPPQLQPIHLAELVEDTLLLLSNQCLKQGVEVKNAFGSNGLLIQADPQQLKQVLLNLLLNSLEAMPDGGRLSIDTRQTASHLVLRIADSGEGMTPEDLCHVWDPFFTTKERGMGLGMAIVKGIVERHGGQVHLSSTIGKGTTAELHLPVI